MCFTKIKTFFLKLFSKNVFVLVHYIPKDATQQDIFISKYPSYDGRGIKISIIDDAVDLSLEGLQKTSEGLPKIIDCFDFTGAGDVDTSVIKEMDSENILIGLSGRKLKIPTKWKNPSGKWHLGTKSLFEPTMSLTTSEKLPEIDCIVWNDGQKWLACIETFGDMENAKILTNFRDSFEYGILTNEVEIVYCITIYDDGNLLEIYAPYYYHGSVVAQIAAANFPKEPEKNGLAPGAQIISMNVIDPDKEHELNLQALKKALLKCIEMKVDIINYSIEGFLGDPEIAKLITEMANNYNILFFTGSGNRGPFYWSAATCEIENSLFTIGAILTSKMKKLIYNVPLKNNEKTLPPMVSDFSSRGPGFHGSRGLDFVAPGAATVDTPQYFSIRNAVCAFFGTSYSTPNAAGAIACLLSALKANSIQYSHFSIKFALFKTAYLPENGNKLEFGHGIIQIDDAFEYCRKNGMNGVLKNLNGSGGLAVLLSDDDNRDIVLHDENLSKFINIKSVDEIAAAEWTLKLSPKSKNFIEISKINENNSLSTKINTKNLDPGCLHYAEMQFTDSLFYIPISVIYALKIPETHDYRIQKDIALNYENPEHIFFIPAFEKKFRITITALQKIKTKICVKHWDIYRDDEAEGAKKILEFSRSNRIQSYYILVKKNVNNQICVHQPMGGISNARFKLEFNSGNQQNKGVNNGDASDTSNTIMVCK